MIKLGLVVFTIIMVLLMTGVVMLAAIFAAKKNTPINRGMRNLSMILLGYMISAFLQYYFQQNMMGEGYVKITGCVADICYFMLIACWLYIINLFSVDIKSIKIKTVFTVTAVYGVAAELIVVLAGIYNKSTAEVAVEDEAWMTALLILNAAYGMFVLFLSIRWFVLSTKNTAGGYSRSGAMFFSGLLSLYMLWILVQDYDTVYNAGEKLTDSIVIDPLFIAYCLLDVAVIYFFFKNDPLELFSQQNEQQREVQIKLFSDANSLTKRESEVLKLVCMGLNNPDIAGSLFISENTVKRHLNNIFQKTGVKNRYELISGVLKK